MSEVELRVIGKAMEKILSPRFTSANAVVTRPVIGAVNLIALLLFFAAQMIFTAFLKLPPWPVFLLCGAGCGLRLLEIVYFLRNGEPEWAQGRAVARASIGVVLILPLLLAILTRQPDTHYFGLLILPILESAIYFSLSSTLVVSTISACLALFWVAYVANFAPPFSPGEILEASTLVLVFFLVGNLVWLLVHLLRSREQELRDRLLDLEAAKNQLVQEEKLAAVGRLASSVAHEIRNPVAIIASSLETAASSRVSDVQKEDMARIASMEAKRLEKLTTDFLAYARPGNAAFQELDITTLVGYIGSIAQAKAMQKELKIQVEDSPSYFIRGNEGQLQQVLLNLLQNAMDASPLGKSIYLRVQGAEADRVKVTIENCGDAIPEHIAGKIFEPFFTAKEGGTGLGLSIARSIVERHQGSLLLEGNQPGRIVFSVLLPKSQAGILAFAPSGKERIYGTNSYR